MSRQINKLSLVLSIIFLASSQLEAAVITWGAATDVNSADLSQLSTNGTLVSAVRAAFPGGGNVVLGSTTFYGTTSVTYPGPGIVNFNPNSNITVTAADGNIGVQNGTDFGLGAYGALMSTTTTDINWGTSSSGDVGGVRDIEIPGLVSGRQYEVQVWVPTFHIGNDFAHDPDPFTSTTFAGAAPVSLLFGLRGDLVDDRAPQFAIGTFTADATNQLVSFTGLYWSALQVRDITPVPEPSSFAILTAALAGLVGLSRRRG